ncbi:MAG: hypothetical protein ACR2KP_04620 [Egibacteraceae bacterium]
MTAPVDSEATERAPSLLAAAITSEAAIGTEARKIRGDATEITPALFLELWPLLRRPIPPALIVTTGIVEGKPYPSTGVKSLQVLTDRMSLVLTPLWWWHEVEYLEANPVGSLAAVTVFVGLRYEDPRVVLCQATSRGGVDRASTLGNLYKGSLTNAAKRAFAEIGPGHEVYLGATDLDPDVSEDAARAQEQPEKQAAKQPPIGEERAAKLADIIAGSPLTPMDVANKLRAFGIKSLADATEAQGLAVVEWVEAAKRAQPDGAPPDSGEGS